MMFLRSQEFCVDLVGERIATPWMDGGCCKLQPKRRHLFRLKMHKEWRIAPERRWVSIGKWPIILQLEVPGVRELHEAAVAVRCFTVFHCLFHRFTLCFTVFHCCFHWFSLFFIDSPHGPRPAGALVTGPEDRTPPPSTARMWACWMTAVFLVSCEVVRCGAVLFGGALELTGTLEYPVPADRCRKLANWHIRFPLSVPISPLEKFTISPIEKFYYYETGCSPPCTRWNVLQLMQIRTPHFPHTVQNRGRARGQGPAIAARARRLESWSSDDEDASCAERVRIPNSAHQACGRPDLAGSVFSNTGTGQDQRRGKR